MKIRFSRTGFEELKEKFERLQSERPSALLDLKKAREMGDLSENGYYKAARAKLSAIDRDLRYLGHLIKNAYVVKHAQDIGVVGVGSKVILKNKDKEITFMIVGDLEANPTDRKISLLSPIGRAINNRSVGEIIEIKTPSGKISYEIIEVS